VQRAWQFEDFIDVNVKDIWVLGLELFAVGCFCVSLIFLFGYRAMVVLNYVFVMIYEGAVMFLMGLLYEPV
jgi:hypothetical protein